MSFPDKTAPYGSRVLLSTGVMADLAQLPNWPAAVCCRELYEKLEAAGLPLVMPVVSRPRLIRFTRQYEYKPWIEFPIGYNGVVAEWDPDDPKIEGNIISLEFNSSRLPRWMGSPTDVQRSIFDRIVPANQERVSFILPYTPRFIPVELLHLDTFQWPGDEVFWASAVHMTPSEYAERRLQMLQMLPE